MQFQYILLLNLLQNLRKITQTSLKMPENDDFSKVWTLLEADLNHKEN